jgi:hypothetical protein
MKKKICAKKRNPARLDIIKLRGISALVTSGGFEPPTSRLGEAPIRHQEVLYSAKKSRNFKAFLLFHIS